MGALVQIPEEDLKCLGEHLRKANEIFNRYGMSFSNELGGQKVAKRTTHKEKVEKYARKLSKK